MLHVTDNMQSAPVSSYTDVQVHVLSGREPASLRLAHQREEIKVRAVQERYHQYLRS